MHTLNGYFALNSVFMLVCLASNCATFENNCVQTNIDRHILSAVQIFSRDSSFWQYKVCANIRLGYLEKWWHQRTLESRVNARLEHLFLAFKNNYVKVMHDLGGTGCKLPEQTCLLPPTSQVADRAKTSRI